MTKTFAQNDKNDLYVGVDGNIAIDEGIFAVQDACLNAAKTQLGEMIFNVNAGIPNFSAVWSGNPNILQFEAAMRITLLSVVDVLGVIDMKTNINSDALSYEATILTKYGTTNVSGDLNVIL
jgi:hypothetical protein